MEARKGKEKEVESTKREETGGKGSRQRRVRGIKEKSGGNGRRKTEGKEIKGKEEG